MKSFEPKVMLLDMLMPVKNGLDMLKEANIKKNYPDTNVVILSNLSDSAMIANVLSDQIISTVRKYA